MIAALAARDMTAERCRAAGPDRRHDLELAAAQMPAMARHDRRRHARRGCPRPPGEAAPWNRRSGLRRWRGRQQRERARHLTDRLQGNAGVEGCGVELPVPEQHLDDPDVGVALQEMRREAVAERVHRDALVELGGVAAA